ncbi:MAG: triose-phosphate isomerase [Vulcanimicrobiaceae bacterium]
MSGNIVKRRPLIAGNWKMNKTVAQARELVRELLAQKLPDGVDVVVAPPFTALAAVAEELRGSSVKLGAQNMSYADEGAFTGEISPVMLKDVGVEYAIIGHSERRAMCGESDGGCNKKVIAALKHGLRPIMAVGETLEEHEAGQTLDVVLRQTKAGLAGLSPEEVGQVDIAYEPIWAIGTGKVDQPENAEAVIAAIRGAVEGLVNSRILYGGSMKGDNAPGLMAQPDIDGGLIGGASLTAKAFLAVIDAAVPKAVVAG